jgi:MFS transporter, SP family, solute carrier family 2 (myo-inositol transporter), member 13
MTSGQRKAAVYVCAALGGVLFGYDTAVVNGALFQLEDDFNLGTNSTIGGLIVSIAVCGAFIGAMFGGFVASRWGRRMSLVVADMFFVIGSCTLAVAPSLTWILIGRVLVGLGIGISSMVVPVYLAEVTEAKTRGTVISINSICICGSQFIASVVCGILVYYSSNSVGWRWMFGLGVVPAAVQLAAIALFLPESPRWLQSSGRESEAQIVASSYGIALSTDTLSHPIAMLSEREQYKIVFGAALRQRVFLGVGLQILQQFSGINTVMYYSASILKNVGFGGGKAPVLLSIPLAFINALFTLIATFYADKLGRKFLLRVSLIGCGTATAGMMVIGILQSTDSVVTSTGGWIFVGLLGTYLMFFAPGLGAMPWVVMSEIYPTNVRSTASGVATMANWASNAIVSQCFPLLVGSIGVGPTFGIIAGIEVIGLLVVSKFVPETKGLTLEEIDAYFAQEGNSASSHLLTSERVSVSHVQ